jgi:hypothetical protein
VFGGDPLWTDATGPIYAKRGDAEKNDRGLPVYPECVIVTQRKEPLVVPVTKERVLQIYITDAASALKDRAAPAVVNMKPDTIFAGAGDTMAFTLIEANPKFFDMARLDQIQIIAVRTGLSDQEREFLPQVDWAGLLAFAK